MIRQDITLEDIQKLNINMTRHLGIEFMGVGPDYISARMPVDSRTTQPMGILHGGASVVLAESLGSIGANLCVDESKYYCVGLEINANHIRPVTQGNWVLGTAKPLHIGKTTQVWEIRITDENHKLVCISRLTVAVIERKNT
ncbi:MAG: hotdog fold thioesterase [Cytophagales bacterium]|nr:hotdog fold thioesterase [Cytophagales bacterium]MDW8385051.1 hotdog fold thioesterase [Flammeovirgaceae bacterium]